MYVCMYVCIYDICSNIYVYMIYMFYIISLYIYISNNQNIIKTFVAVFHHVI